MFPNIIIILTCLILTITYEVYAFILLGSDQDKLRDKFPAQVAQLVRGRDGTNSKLDNLLTPVVGACFTSDSG